MTAKQKQCLLTYLGYDTGGVDGIWIQVSTLGSGHLNFATEIQITKSG